MIGNKVRNRREELGLTGAQLAAKAGMAPSAVSQIETGRRTPNSASVIKLAEALGVEVATLYPKKAQAPLPFEGVGAGPETRDLTEQDLTDLDEQGLADLYGDLLAELGRARERVAEIERLCDEVHTALILALNSQHWELSELTKQSILRDRRRKAAQRIAEDAESEAG
jgi:transcriptional regulator with XRE-family HTH domain